VFLKKKNRIFTCQYVSALVLLSLYFPAVAVTAQETSLPKISAPNSAASIPQEANGLFNKSVIVTGWTCGEGTHSVIARVGELVRQQSLLQAKFDSLEEIDNKFAGDDSVSVFQKNAVWRKSETVIEQAYQPIIEPLSEGDIAAMSANKFPRAFDDMATYKNQKVSFIEAGISDGGTTAVFALRDCVQTAVVDQFKAQIRLAATKVIELETSLKELEDSFLGVEK